MCRGRAGSGWRARGACLLMTLAFALLAPAPAPAQGLTTLSHGKVSKSPLYWGHWVANAKGFFRDEQLRLETVMTRSSSLGVQALIAGSLDVVGVSCDTPILAAEKGSDVAIVAGIVNKPTYSVVVGPQIKTIEELRGKTLGVSNVKTGEVVFLKKALEKHGLREGDYRLIAAGGAAERYAAMQKGLMAGTVLPSPFDFRLEDIGLRILMTTSQALPEYQFLVEAVRRDWARANEATLVRFARALQRTYRWMNDPANRDEASEILGKELSLDIRFTRRAYDLWIARERAYSAELRPAGLQAVLAYLVEIGEMKPPLPAPSKYLELTYLERAGSR
ncbi:MAG: ABC transporter substrate-binding protein [Deltaproteobacteria bacterium]|nr:ABC transporter substrate-binding protein [Deltaproteobacteria bacterium]